MASSNGGQAAAEPRRPRALVLRTLIGEGNETWLRAGAGVTAQSSPEREIEETCEKLRSVAPHLRYVTG